MVSMVIEAMLYLSSGCFDHTKQIPVRFFNSSDGSLSRTRVGLQLGTLVLGKGKHGRADFMKP
jgi:hypothetical protein